MDYIVLDRDQTNNHQSARPGMENRNKMHIFFLKSSVLEFKDPIDENIGWKRRFSECGRKVL